MNWRELEQKANRAARAALRRIDRERKKEQEASQAPKQTSRMYSAARQSRLTADWSAGTTSADAEIKSSLTTLRARCRALDRDSAYARRARTVVVNNVIGSGIGIQAHVRSTRNRLMPRVNETIEQQFMRWWTRADWMHTGGTLAGGDFERAVMSEVFQTGEAFILIHRDSFGGSPIPMSLELVESERVPHGIRPEASDNFRRVRMGIEVDRYFRPQAYYVRNQHPSDFSYPAGIDAEQTLRIPAADMIHLRIVDRWPQTRGIPWLHAVAKKLNDMDGYTEAEIVAARGAANYMASIETDPLAQIGEEQQDGTRQVEVSPGMVVQLAAGEKMNFHNPNRPNTALDSFMRYMIREFAAGVNVSYESVSRDYSQSNYSSSRLALMDDRDTWRVLQNWYLQCFRSILHRQWLQTAVLAREIPNINLTEYGVNPEKYESVKWKPRGWSWIDPTKEVAAYREAEKAGYITKTQIIAQTGAGQDFADTMDERKRELEEIEDRGLSFETDTPSQSVQSMDDDSTPEDDDQPDDDDNRQMRLVK